MGATQAFALISICEVVGQVAFIVLNHINTPCQPLCLLPLIPRGFPLVRPLHGRALLRPAYDDHASRECYHSTVSAECTHPRARATEPNGPR